MLKEKSLQVFTDPENPNHENHDFVAWMLGWQGAWKCQRSCVEILCETDPEKAEEKDLPKKDKKERRLQYITHKLCRNLLSGLYKRKALQCYRLFGDVW